jgi:phytoene dehydrogenase-like protein
MADVAIIGGGHNGLVAAFYLAKAGLSPIVLERRVEVGGGAITGEIHPGFKAPTLSHSSHLWSEIVHDLDLRRHGLEVVAAPTQVFAPSADGRALVLHDSVRRSQESIHRFSAKDAEAYPLYRQAIDRIASVVGSIFTTTPPSIDGPTTGDLWNLLKTARKFRALGRQDGYRLLRWGPMAVADLVHEWFGTEVLSATIAARGVSGTMLGPWSAGSALVLLMREAHHQLAGGASGRVRGGPGAMTRAMASAATAAGAEIRTAAAVEHIVVKNDRAAAVVLSGGEEIAVRAVLSAADPKTTFLSLVDPIDLTPDFLMKMKNYRSAGTLAKVNLALSSLPSFAGGDPDSLSGRIHIGPEIDYLERAFDHAKYGEYSSEPWLDITIPSILDPQLAPDGAHVMSIYAHYAPYRLRGTPWDASREALGQAVLRTLERYAPGLGRLVVARQVITPDELDRTYGFAGGHIFHGELALDQLFTMRPLLGYADYRSPVAGLYLCGAGTHPGGFLTGGSGRNAAREVVRDLKS